MKKKIFFGWELATLTPTSWHLNKQSFFFFFCFFIFESPRFVLWWVCECDPNFFFLPNPFPFPRCHLLPEWSVFTCLQVRREEEEEEEEKNKWIRQTRGLLHLRTFVQRGRGGGGGGGGGRGVGVSGPFSHWQEAKVRTPPGIGRSLIIMQGRRELGWL